MQATERALDNKELTPFLRGMVREYLNNGGNKTRAFLSLKPKAGYDYAKKEACNLFQKPAVQIYLKELELEQTQDATVTKKELLKEAREITVLAKEDKQYQAALKGNELSGKYIGAFDNDEDSQGKYVQFIQQIAGDHVVVNIGSKETEEKEQKVINGEYEETNDYEAGG